MVFGEEVCFLVKDPSGSTTLYELFLRYLGIDTIGIKMKGIFARFWSKRRHDIVGPLLFHEKQIYQVIAFDYDCGKIWLSQLQ